MKQYEDKIEELTAAELKSETASIVHTLVQEAESRKNTFLQKIGSLSSNLATPAEVELLEILSREPGFCNSFYCYKNSIFKIEQNQIKVIKKLEEYCKKNSLKLTPVRRKVLELLLEKGADGNACNKWRETPLLIAANNGHKAAVEALLKHGADPSLCSEAGWSALTFAAHKVRIDDILNLLYPFQFLMRF